MSGSPVNTESLPTNTESAWGRAGDVFEHPAEGIFGQPTWSGVFNKALSTITGKNAYETDKAQADFKLLNKENIASPNAMSGLQDGSQQTNVRGNSVTQVTSDRYEKVDGADYLLVDGLQTYQVKGDAIFLYNLTRKVVVGQDYDLSVKGKSSTFVLGTSAEQFIGKHEVTAPEEFEWKQMERGFSFSKLDLGSLLFDIHGTSVEVGMANGEVTLVDLITKLFKEKSTGQEGEFSALIMAIGCELDIEVRGDALIDVGLGTPFR